MPVRKQEYAPRGADTDAHRASCDARLGVKADSWSNVATYFYVVASVGARCESTGFLFSGVSMDLQESIEREITEEADKLALRYHAYHNALHAEHVRQAKRVKSPPTKIIKQPAYWAVDRKFNPFYVRKHRAAIAHSIAQKILTKSYLPNPPFEKEIAKSGGGTRNISVFQIPDAAVSRMIYKQLLRKNRHRFSGYSYAYRDDRNAHFAIQDIAIDLAQHSRMFVAEFDFSKFFDSVNHGYLYAQFDQNGFSISPRECEIISAFLRHRSAGIPQGTSISLFLANLVCWRLDKDLQDAGLRFARYADDTLIWSPEYERVSRAVRIIGEFSSSTGIQINQQKSKGVRILCPQQMPAELAQRTTSVDFLGYSISVDRVSIKDSSVKKIKRQINYILYKHLIQPLRGARLRGLVIPSAKGDPALLSALMEIRRFLYGNLSDDFLRRYLAGSSGRIFYKGVMSFYPLISDKDQMRELDGWLISQVQKTVTLRKKLLMAWRYNRSHLFPFNVARSEIPKAFRERRIDNRSLLAIPSFVVVYLALRKSISENGFLELLAKKYKDD